MIGVTSENSGGAQQAPEQISGYLCAPQQRRLWKAAGTVPKAFTIGIWDLQGPLDTGRLHRALDKALRAHPSLRTRFLVPPGLTHPIQVVEPEPECQWHTLDLDLPNQPGETRLLAFLETQEAPGIHVVLAKHSEDRHLFGLRLPSMCADRKSLEIITKDWARHYAAEARGETADASHVPFYQYSEWLQQLADQDEHGSEFWRPFKVAGEPRPHSPVYSPQRLPVMHLAGDQADAAIQKAGVSYDAFWMTLLAILKARFTQSSRAGLGVCLEGRSFSELGMTAGPFERLVPVVLAYDGGAPFQTLAKNLDASLESAMAWQDYFDLEPGTPFPLPNWAIHFERVPSTIAAGDLQIASKLTQRIGEAVAIGLRVRRGPEGVGLVLVADSAVIDNATARSLCAMLKALIQDVVTTGDMQRCAGALPLMSQIQAQQLIASYQGPSGEQRFKRPFDQLFSQKANARPNQTAMIHGDRSLTYRELETRSNRIAHELLDRGVAANQFVGVSTLDPLAAIPAMLGVLKSGAAYVYLDLELPVPRFEQMVADCQPAAMLTQTQHATRFSDAGFPCLFLDGEDPEWARHPAQSPAFHSQMEDAAYLVFTSGSTGRPKGVVVEHGNLINYLNGIFQAIPAVETCRSFGLVSSLAADLGHTMLFPSLLTGATLHLISRDQLFNGLSFGAYCTQHKLEALKITPSHLQTLMMQPQPRLALPEKVLILGGESLGQPLARRIQDLNPNLQIFNHYGPSETCVGVLTQAYRGQQSGATVPIGKPIAFTQVYIVNPQNTLQPPGLPGELLIGGRSVSRGYLANPAETKRRFIQNPFETALVQAPVLYRSGDRVRSLPGGRIEFLGRVDRQIKLRGFRIELEEIEQTLLAHPNIEHARVSLCEDEAKGKELTAWVATADLDGAQVRAYLETCIPTAMIPARVHCLDAFPLTANGKVDQDALNRMTPDESGASGPFVAPRTSLEIVLATIWQDVLGKQKVGMTDAFFDLGGHSLLLIVVNTRIKELFRKELSTADLFRARTLTEMAALLQNDSLQPGWLDMVAQLLLDLKSLTPSQKAECQEKARAYFHHGTIAPPKTQAANPEEAIANSFDDLLLLDYFLCLAGHPPAEKRGLSQRPQISERPLSFEQQRLWFLDQLEEGQSSAYNNTLALRLRGPLSTKALHQAMHTMETRHHSLRTTFELNGADPVTVLQSPQPHPLGEIDLSDIPEMTKDRLIQGILQAAASTPFNLKTGPVWRSLLLRIGPAHHVWIIVIHHICSDGWSMAILEKEIVQCYRAFLKEEAPFLPELPIQYTDYAWWQRQHFQGDVLERYLTFWREHLAHQSLVPQWPTDHPRPPIQTYRGAMLPIKYSGERRDELLQAAREAQASLFMVFLSAFAQLQSFYARQSKVRIGTDLANRGHRETESLFGFFVNQLVFCIDVNPTGSLRSHLAHCRDVAVKAYAQSALPFDQMVNRLNLERNLSYSPVFQTKVFLEHRHAGTAEGHGFPGLDLSHLNPENSGAARLDLTLGLWDLGESGIEGWLSYNTDLFDKSTCEEIAAMLDLVLTQMISGPDRSIQELEQRLTQEKQTRAEAARTEQNKLKMKKFKRGARKKVVISPKNIAHFEPLDPSRSQPAMLKTGLSDFNLVSWAQENRETWQKELRQAGSLLFRGFGIQTPERMAQVSQVFIDQLFTTNAEHQPIGNGIQIPVDYAADQFLLWHSENSFNHEWPQTIMFACGIPADAGGQTPLVDNRAVYRNIDPAIRRRFEEKGVMYVRNCNPHLGLDWRKVLNVSHRGQAFERCEALRQTAEWRPGGVLKTRAVRPAIIRHPVTGELSWFNQAQHWHAACLDPDTRSSVTQLYAEEDYPRHCYFGDGSPIEDAVMEHILEVYRSLEVSFPWARGDLLVVDNVLTAHARKPYRGERRIYVAMGDLRAYDAEEVPVP